MKKFIALFFVIFLTLALAGCGQDAPGGEIQVRDLCDLAGTTKIILTNAHNGERVYIKDKAQIEEIAAFVGETVGQYDGSGKGYYEGTYSVEFYNGEENIFSLGYGDSNCFYTGKGDDGYPLRYLLVDRTIADDVIPFFTPYDPSLN